MNPHTSIVIHTDGITLEGDWEGHALDMGKPSFVNKQGQCIALNYN
jgi:hypothetical protein